MPKRSLYTAQEDLLLAESMFEVRRRYKRNPSATFRFRFPEVYNLFIRKCSIAGIGESIRTEKSVESRLYHIRETHRKGQLRRVFDGDDAICLKCHATWIEVLENEVSPTKYQTSRNEGASYPHFQAGAYEEGQELPSHVDEPPKKNKRKHSNQQRQENAKRFLDTFTKACKERAAIEKKREETLRRQQRLAQDQRSWRIEMLRNLIQQSNGDDDDSFSAFLETLEELAKKDAELSRLREESAAERVEDDRENWEWERDTYEDLLTQYIDKHDKC